MPKNKRWQYQIKADVVTVPGELITLDKWFTPAIDPTKLPKTITYITPSVFEFVETITLDKWYVQIVDPVKLRFKPYYYPCIDYRELSIPFIPPAFQPFFDNYMRIEDE